MAHSSPQSILDDVAMVRENLLLFIFLFKISIIKLAPLNLVEFLPVLVLDSIGLN